MRHLAAASVLVLLTTVGGLVAWASTVNVATGSFYFEDASVGDGRITAEVGDQLRFAIEDSGRGTPHTVEIPGLGISSGPLSANATYVTAVITQPGTFEVFCKPHRAKGHATTLVVTGAAQTTTTAQGTSTSTTTTTTTTTTTPVQVNPTTTTLQAGPTPQTDASPTTTEPESDTKTLGGVPEQTAETLPVGVSKPDTQQWTAAIPVALLTLVPLVAIAAAAGTRQRTRNDQ